MRDFLCDDSAARFLRKMREEPGKWASRFLLLLGPWTAFWMVELLNENDVFTDLLPWQITLNLIWYYALFFLCRLVLGRRKWAGTAGMLLSFLAGLLNHYVLRFRGRILFPADLRGWRTAANVARGFDYAADRYIVQAAVLRTSYLFLLWTCPGQRRRDRMPRPLWTGLLLALGSYGYAFFGTDMLPNMGVYTQQWATQANGFLLNFTVAMRYSAMDRPAAYSRERVVELMERYPAQEGAGSAARPVNIITVMNESFADLTIFDGLELSQDPTPFLHSLEEDAVKGWMYAPVTGGGTASVEFEYLTGFSTLFQPPHTVAYQLYMEKDMPSLAALAKSRGYRTAAFHPYKSSGWNRPVAYDDLGFLDQYYGEDVRAPYIIRHYISDRSDYETIFRLTREREPLFLFNVTIQNHSGYAQGWNNLNQTSFLSGALEAADPDAEQYFSLLRASDDALRELVEHFRQVEEPTLIVFFGDHQPPLKNAFYEALYGKKLSQRTTQEVLRQYAVPFFIWANYDIPERRDVILSPNYLGVLAARTAGLPLTAYMSFLSRMYDALPVITPVGFITEKGECLTEEELSEEQRQWVDEYELLNYCGIQDLFDGARGLFCAEGG